MKRRSFLALTGAAAAFPRAALAQQAAKVPRIAVVANALAEDRKQAVLQGLADHGHIDGKTVAVEFFVAPTIADVPAYAARAVASKPDLIVTTNSAPPLALRDLTTTIPIVFAGLQDPVAIGLVASYARPGGNITGTMIAGPDYAGKQVELIREVLPKLKTLAMVALPADPPYAVQLAQILAATNALNIESVVIETKEGDEFVPLFERAIRSGATGVFIFGASYITALPNSAVLAGLSLAYKLPAFSSAAGGRNGMVLGYGANINDVARRSGAYVDAILKGAKPADLPVDQPRLFDLVVNLKTAKALGLTIPPSILVQATEVIS